MVWHIITKSVSLYITKWVNLSLLQSGTILLQSGTAFVITIFLQSGTGITKWDDYYKVGFNTKSCFAKLRAISNLLISNIEN